MPSVASVADLPLTLLPAGHPAFAYAAQLLEDIAAVRRRETIRRSDDNSRRKVAMHARSSIASRCTSSSAPRRR